MVLHHRRVRVARFSREFKTQPARRDRRFLVRPPAGRCGSAKSLETLRPGNLAGRTFDRVLRSEATLTTALRHQRTLAGPCTVAGFGYWGGRDVNVEFRPGPPHTGIVFVRRDFEPARRIPADVHKRIEVPRRTTLVADGTQVEMVEHVLAALYGLAIDNCEVRVDSSELPGLDGS